MCGVDEQNVSNGHAAFLFRYFVGLLVKGRARPEYSLYILLSKAIVKEKGKRTATYVGADRWAWHREAAAERMRDFCKGTTV